MPGECLPKAARLARRPNRRPSVFGKTPNIRIARPEHRSGAESFNPKGPKTASDDAQRAERAKSGGAALPARAPKTDNAQRAVHEPGRLRAPVFVGG